MNPWLVSIAFLGVVGVSALLVETQPTVIPAVAALHDPVELLGSADLPNGWQVFALRVDALVPYQCLVLATPQGGQLKCDVDGTPIRR